MKEEDDDLKKNLSKCNRHPPKRLTARALVIRKRRQKIADLLLMGVVDHIQIAARLDCGDITAYNDIRAIFKQWAIEDKSRMQQKISYRVRQLSLAAREAINSFENSKQSKTNTTTAYKNEPCPNCGEWGVVKKKKCKTCDGKGTVFHEVTTSSKSGTAGDSSFLRTYIDAVKEMATIQGIHHYNKMKASKMKPPRPVFVPTAAYSVDWRCVSDDKLLQIKGECQRLLEESKTSVDASFAPAEEDD